MPRKKQFEKIYQENIEKVYRFVYARLYRKAEAEDITSRAFVIAYEKYIDNEELKLDNPSAWVIQIARNIMCNESRKKKASPLEEEYEMKIPDKAERVEEVTMTKEDVGLVKKHFKKLKPELREVLTLKIWEEYKFREIAEVVGATENAVKKRYYRGVEYIKKYMKADEQVAYGMVFAGIKTIGTQPVFSPSIGLINAGAVQLGLKLGSFLKIGKGISLFGKCVTVPQFTAAVATTAVIATGTGAGVYVKVAEPETEPEKKEERVEKDIQKEEQAYVIVEGEGAEGGTVLEEAFGKKGILYSLGDYENPLYGIMYENEDGDSVKALLRFHEDSMCYFKNDTDFVYCSAKVVATSIIQDGGSVFIQGILREGNDEGTEEKYTIVVNELKIDIDSIENPDDPLVTIQPVPDDDLIVIDDPPVGLPGDVSNDGIVDSVDHAMVFSYFMGFSDLTSEQKFLASRTWDDETILDQTDLDALEYCAVNVASGVPGDCFAGFVPTVHIKGDANGDGEVDVVDLQLTINEIDEPGSWLVGHGYINVARIWPSFTQITDEDREGLMYCIAHQGQADCTEGFSI